MSQVGVPTGSMHFRVEIDGASVGSALEVVFPEARLEARRRGRSETIVEHYGPLVLRRGYTLASDWYAWWHLRRERRRRVSRTIAVTLLDGRERQAARWILSGCEPVAYRLSNLNALSNELLIETLEVAVQRFAAEETRATSAGRTGRSN